MREIKDITIKGIAALVKADDITRALEYHYPHLKVPKGYSLSMLKRFVVAKKKPKDPKERIEVYAYSNDWGDEDGVESSYGIHTIEPHKQETWGKPKSWSMSFRPWDELINMKVYSGTFEHYTLADILAHFIYEITWYGPEKEMRRKGKALLTTVKKATKATK